MFRRKWVLVLLVLVIAGGGAAAYFAKRAVPGVQITAETIQRRDLEAIVSASGKIQPKKTVNISAQGMGRVTRLAVEEGDRVKAGQFLLQIDPITAQSAVRRDEAAVAGARTSLAQSRATLRSTQASLEVARQALRRQQDLWEAGLTTKETLEKAQADVDMRESDLQARQQEIRTREEQLRQQEAGLVSSQHSLSQASFNAPFDGIVTRRNVEEGENVVVGTMNNAGTVLLTVADMSVIEAEIEVDETDIPLVQFGQRVKVTIDALPDQTFDGEVTEIGNSPIQATGTQTSTAATNFKVVVTLHGQVPNVRPGFTCTAEITTATRTAALSVPIQALTIREMVYDAQGNVVPQVRPEKTGFSFGGGAAAAAQTPAPRVLEPGQRRDEVEGVFVVTDGKATFTQVTVGIAGERYFEVSSGLSEGDRVITGPFDSVRGLLDGDAVKEAPATGSAAAASGPQVRVGS